MDGCREARGGNDESIKDTDNMRVFELYTHLITSLGTVLQCVWRIEENYMFLLHVIGNAGHTKCTINLEGLISNTAHISLR